MKAKLLFLAGLFLALGVAFTSCDDDDNDINPGKQYTDALQAKYPDARNVKWENKDGYTVADFTLNGVVKRAWYNSSVQEVMTETGTNFDALPVAIRNSYGQNPYAQWYRDDVSQVQLLTTNTNVYTIAIKQDKRDMVLVYLEDGTLIKTGINMDKDTEYLPVSAQIQGIVNDKLPGSVVYLVYKGDENINAVALQNGIYQTVTMNNQFQWLKTSYETTWDALPDIVKTSYQASSYNGLTIYQIDDVQSPAGHYYWFVLQSGDAFQAIMINDQGAITQDR